MLFISPRNTDTQNVSMLQKANVHSLLYADDMKSLADRLQCAAGGMAISRVPDLYDTLAKRGPPYRFEASFEELQDECCLILHSSGSTGNQNSASLNPYSNTLKDLPNLCILRMVHFLSLITTHICQCQRAVVRKMPRNSISVHRGVFTPVFRPTM